MNEEELKKRREYLREGETDGDFLNWCDKVDLYEKGFQKGKLEQKKEELKFLKERCIYCMIADERIKQLQKEIGDDSQTRQSKETSVEKGGDKAERYLFNSDNVSSADTLKLNHRCPICDKRIFLNEEIANTKKGVYHLDCLIRKTKAECKEKFKEMIEKLLSIKEEELILWSVGYGRDGKKLKRKGFSPNPNFRFIANGYEQGLKELLQKADEVLK